MGEALDTGNRTFVQNVRYNNALCVASAITFRLHNIILRYLKYIGKVQRLNT